MGNNVEIKVIYTEGWQDRLAKAAYNLYFKKKKVEVAKK